MRYEANRKRESSRHLANAKPALDCRVLLRKNLLSGSHFRGAKGDINERVLCQPFTLGSGRSGSRQDFRRLRDRPILLTSSATLKSRSDGALDLWPKSKIFGEQV
ncbi:hypothetical protein CA13_53240 [Planctomycetes bacterium CA13]|uniref:Uncharacterized protein n=1 Tax=Novipirellula herctigrandis TaxID=2527986 RepID=A0A5C5ZAL3_9BACT|nr:hypothetical protein CA13_53240 [Planctomycetes bacterium CA13]